MIISGNRALRTAEMDSLGETLSHAPVITNGPKALSTARCNVYNNRGKSIIFLIQEKL